MFAESRRCLYHAIKPIPQAVISVCSVDSVFTNAVDMSTGSHRSSVTGSSLSAALPAGRCFISCVGQRFVRGQNSQARDFTDSPCLCFSARPLTCSGRIQSQGPMTVGCDPEDVVKISNAPADEVVVSKNFQILPTVQEHYMWHAELFGALGFNFTPCVTSGCAVGFCTRIDLAYGKLPAGRWQPESQEAVQSNKIECIWSSELSAGSCVPELYVFTTCAIPLHPVEKMNFFVEFVGRGEENRGAGDCAESSLEGKNG
ncbi:hypothetical protein R3P38DRAFT_2787336 [Favolaschia claudopus]|uniref:Uncharacterized protein n=1 Tax=Favolaschia claudopus TaxID=2862362 RepID=A0AAW0AQ47_9AGAR